MSMKIFKNLEEMKVNVCHYFPGDMFYMEEENLAAYHSSVGLTFYLLENARKSGKKVKVFEYRNDSREGSYLDGLCDFINANSEISSRADFYRLFTNPELDEETMPKLIKLDSKGENIIQNKCEEVSAWNIYSPFLKPKKVKDLSKMNRTKLINLLMNGQAYKCLTNYSYTDDYRLDEGNNFSRGLEVDLKGFAFDLVQGKQRLDFWISEDDPKKDYIVITAKFHSNHSSSIYVSRN